MLSWRHLARAGTWPCACRRPLGSDKPCQTLWHTRPTSGRPSPAAHHSRQRPRAVHCPTLAITLAAPPATPWLRAARRAWAAGADPLYQTPGDLRGGPGDLALPRRCLPRWRAAARTAPWPAAPSGGAMQGALKPWVRLTQYPALGTSYTLTGQRLLAILVPAFHAAIGGIVSRTHTALHFRSIILTKQLSDQCCFPSASFPSYAAVHEAPSASILNDDVQPTFCFSLHVQVLLALEGDELRATGQIGCNCMMS